MSYTDNVLQTPGNRQGEALASTGFDLDYTHKGSYFDFDSRGALNWVEYLNGAYSGAASGALNARALVGNSNDLLQWAAWETFGQLNTDPLAAPTPVNIENVNYFTTGPLLNFVSTSGNRLSIRGLYSKSTYQKSPYDSDSVDVGASLSHALSVFSSISLDVDQRNTRFRDQLNAAANYDVRSAFLGYVSRLSRTQFSAEAGYTYLHFKSLNSGSPLLSLGLNRRISASSSLYLQAQTGFSQGAESIRTAAGLATPSAAFAGASSPNPFKQQTVSVGWTFERPRTTFWLFATGTRQRYEHQTVLDENNISLEAQVLRRIRATLIGTLSVQQSRQKYTNLGADVSQLAVVAALSKSFTRFGISLRYERFHRGGSSNGGGLVAVYDENRLGLYVSYDVLGHHVNPNGLMER